MRRFAGLTTLAVAAVLAIPALASARTDVCQGTLADPGVLSGVHRGDVLVKGACEVNDGPAKVYGTITVATDSALAALFGRDNSRLTVERNIRVEREGALFLGCLPSSMPCLDDPSMDNPTLSSHEVVEGNIIGQNALGIVVHNTAIHGNVNQSGGGGGTKCDPNGFFINLGSPVFTTYEDSTIGGNTFISNYHSCWMGFNRVHAAHRVAFEHNQLADPDAIEILDNHIGGDLVCHDNSMVWDSSDLGPGLYPRQPQPNTVLGARVGQCVLASPPTDSSPPGPGPF
jgi:hypothetical protein